MKGLETRRRKGEKWKRKEWETEKKGKENELEGDENYESVGRHQNMGRWEKGVDLREKGVSLPRLTLLVIQCNKSTS